MVAETLGEDRKSPMGFNSNILPSAALIVLQLKPRQSILVVYFTEPKSRKSQVVVMVASANAATAETIEAHSKDDIPLKPCSSHMVFSH